jgi:hypothetical protein
MSTNRIIIGKINGEHTTVTGSVTEGGGDQAANHVNEITVDDISGRVDITGSKDVGPQEPGS